MSCPLCERNQNKTYPNLIHEFQNSYLYLGEHQYYQGYCVLVSKVHYREMTDMPEPSRSELFQEMMSAHAAIVKTFNPKKMNMCSLGNVVDHIHWHFFPRYSDDANFKNPPWLQMDKFDSAKVSPTERDEVIKKIQKNLK
jgi:diadenosine tetraphosphate (Ap4A) HIT family hydrolase